MKPTLDERTYYLKQFRKGWRARVRDSKATGWGTTPELAIYDWRKQHAALVVNQQPATKHAGKYRTLCGTEVSFNNLGVHNQTCPKCLSHPYNRA